MQHNNFAYTQLCTASQKSLHNSHILSHIFGGTVAFTVFLMVQTCQTAAVTHTAAGMGLSLQPCRSVAVHICSDVFPAQQRAPWRLCHRSGEASPAMPHPEPTAPFHSWHGGIAAQPDNMHPIAALHRPAAAAAYIPGSPWPPSPRPEASFDMRSFMPCTNAEAQIGSAQASLQDHTLHDASA